MEGTAKISRESLLPIFEKYSTFLLEKSLGLSREFRSRFTSTEKFRPGVRDLLVPQVFRTGSPAFFFFNKIEVELRHCARGISCCIQKYCQPLFYIFLEIVLER